MLYDGKSGIILTLFLLEVVCSFSLSAFKILLCSSYEFCLVLSELDRSVLVSVTVLENSYTLFLQISSTSIFSFQASNYICQTIWYCPRALGYSILFFIPYLFLFPFQSGSSDYPSSSSSLLILSLAVSNLMNLSKIVNLCHYSFISSISACFFPLCFIIFEGIIYLIFMFYNFSIIAFIIFIIIILNLLFDSSNICVISDSYLNVCFVSLDCVPSCLLVCHITFC